MNILILAAGGSEAYSQAGYAFPKNLIEINHRPLIQHALGNVTSLSSQGARFHVVLRREECQKYHTDQVVKLLEPRAQVILGPSNTSGACCTALLASSYIDNEEPLLIVNGDQLLFHDHVALVQHFLSMKWDGAIPVFDDVHPRYSYVKLDANNMVVEAAEKRPISRYASAGRYFFRKGSTFVRCAKKMILKDAHVDGSFYVCPVYNELVLEGGSIGVAPIQRDQYINLSSPSGLQDYINLNKSMS